MGDRRTRASIARAVHGARLHIITNFFVSSADALFVAKHAELKDRVLESLEEHKQIKTLLREMESLTSDRESQAVGPRA